jgi:hypothetical protein
MLNRLQRALAMVYYGVLDFVHRPIFYRTRRIGNLTFFRSLEASILLGSLERANPSITVLHSHLRTETDPVCDMLFL